MIKPTHSTNAGRTNNRSIKQESDIPLTASTSRNSPPLSHLYTEEMFHALYNQECKRTERSGNAFILMLIDITRLGKMSVDDAIGVFAASRLTSLIEQQLFEITRDHDSKGWYRSNDTIGIIFTEIQSIEKEAFTDKILIGLRTILDPDQMEQITISSYLISGKETGPVGPDGMWKDPGDLIEKNRSMSFHSLSAIQKRIVDILGASVGIVLFFPVFIIIAILIKSTSKGPVFFRQERVGRDGKTFTMLKFRSMQVNNDPTIHQEYVKKLIKGEIEGETDNGGKKIYKIMNDPRVTQVGRFIRKTSLDELPQFFNVFKGEMSLVGPRPALPYEVAEYNTWHCRRVTAKPGITGFWQVEGRSGTTFDGMVRMDIRYIRRWSLLLDLKLIIKTPFSLLSAKGAF